MAKSKKLINKLERRQRFVREKTKDIPKLNKAEEVLEDSPKAAHLMLGAQRRMDKSFGYDTVGMEPMIEAKVLATTLERFDFGGSDFGIRATISGAPLQPALPEISKVTCVDDVSSSLNDTYFLIDTPSTDYYVWFNVDAAGTDPMIVGRTGVEVAISADDLAATIAAAIAAELDPLSTLAAQAVGAEVTITDSAAGPAPDTVDGAVPTGFSFQTIQQGTIATGTPVQQLRVLPGDTVQILEGSQQGKMLEVISLPSGSQIRLDDIASFGMSQSDVWLRVLLSASRKSYF